MNSLDVPNSPARYGSTLYFRTNSGFVSSTTTLNMLCSLPSDASGRRPDGSSQRCSHDSSNCSSYLLRGKLRYYGERLKL